MKKQIVLAIAVVLIIVTALQLKKSRDRNVSLSEDISLDEASVSVANVVKRNVSLSLDFTGTLYPEKELDIAAETQGKITSLNFTLGQLVQRGSVVALIDDKVRKLNFESAKIDADKLEKDLERTENLYKGGTASGQELDNSRSSYETAKNKLDEAEKQFSDTKITSSISGVITEKKIEEGTYVNPGTVIASIVDIARLKVRLHVSEAYAYRLKVGDKVTMSTDVYPGVGFTGTISFISSRGDDAHNYPVEIEMVNSTKNPLKAGTFVRVNIKIDAHRDGLFIPREALQGSIKEARIYVAENSKARLKEILIGEGSGDLLEVISGVSETDKIIVSGQVNLSDGKPIKIIGNS